ncbi:MAG: Cna B-type domain-containing protein [Romboutsia sp.]|uniref:Cna B-type domain-containing protein n=1 Tax=Romboutsia sp. TaxID=1965302 RepID=UPI003F355696
MQQSIIKKLFLFFVFLICIVPVSVVSASGNIDTNKTGSLAINHSYKENPIKDTKFKIYQVGNLSGDNKFVLTDDFSKYDIDLNNIKEQSKYDEIADTLATYTQVDNINPYKEQKTDINGKTNFNNLKTGLYLVVVDTSTLNGNYIKTKPFLVSLPSKDKITNEWIYDVNATTKNNEVSGSYINLDVEKIWINDENIKNRPTSIEVELYRNNELYKSIVLDENNKWQYTFEKLDSKYNYSVKEKNVPKNYVVSYEKYTTLIKIKNKYNNTVKPPIDEELPQTGTLLREAQILSIIGLTFMTAGYFVKHKDE